MTNVILAINGGSSTIKCSLFSNKENPEPLLEINIQNIGLLVYTDFCTEEKGELQIDLEDKSAVVYIVQLIQKQQPAISRPVIVHRVVFGMDRIQPEKITASFIAHLRSLIDYDPEHMPQTIALIESFQQLWPDVVQVACFDSSFHASMPVVAKMLAIPRRYYVQGIQRYGFHGLSYSYLLEQLAREALPQKIPSRIILAHLGSGASLVAVKDGLSIDTSMAFTPASGIPMSSRSGDIDPGAAWFILKSENLNAEQFNHLVNHESGMLGISETTADMRTLLANQYTDHRASEAIDLFCYQVKKQIGSFAAVLGGVDLLVFSGGIGEHLPEIRRRICSGLEFLGIELDEIQNNNNTTTISTASGKSIVRVIATNEQLMMARLVCKLFDHPVKN
jgi:acetate kinase